MTSPVVLAIETSQRRGGVALRDAAGDVHVELLAKNLRHDDELLPAIDRLFARAGLKPASLGDRGVVGVSIGPGGFTGLRIGISTAKIFGAILGARLVAVPSALVVAEDLDPGSTGQGQILVALASKQETFWATRLERTGDGTWQIAGTPGLAQAASCSLDGLVALLGDDHLSPVVRERALVGGLNVIEPRFDPARCLAVTCRLSERGCTVDPMALLPLYPREPEAVALWARRREP